ncbi:hypothetical protein FRB93_009305 [Tulasnella sp. JGI-2019a]|nr:hypothetical protein FRB93_009305 [Tulasnella sp. JGI-2019a]
MPGRPLLLFIALFTVLGAVLYLKVKVFGLFRSPISLNNENCVTIPGLEACEEGWVDRRLGLAYLACSDIPSRGAWVPSMDRYNASALPDISTDYIALLSLTPPYKYRALKITGLPKEAHGIWTHGMRVWQDPSDPAALTLFLVSHRPPVNRASAPKVGADSVVEIFRTRAGEDEVQWVRTVKHNLIRTPNTVVPVGPMSFYVSNDHAKKTQWMRELNVLYTTSSEIIYCDASTRNSDCKVAADGIIYPNGMAVGSKNGLIYNAPTHRGGVQVWERNADNTLSLVDDVKMNYAIDNLHTDVETGHIYANAFPLAIKFAGATTPEGVASGRRCPIETWRIVQGSDGKHTAKRVFADPGTTVNAATTSAPFGNKILFIGLAAPNAVICTIK